MLINFVDALKITSADLSPQSPIVDDLVNRQRAIVAGNRRLRPRRNDRAAPNFFILPINVNLHKRARIAVVLPINVGVIARAKHRASHAPVNLLHFNRLNAMRVIPQNQIGSELQKIFLPRALKSIGLRIELRPPMRHHDNQIGLVTLRLLKIRADFFQHALIIRIAFVDEKRTHERRIAVDHRVGIVIIDAVSISEERHLEPAAFNHLHSMRRLILRAHVRTDMRQIFLIEYRNRPRGSVQIHIEQMIVGGGDQIEARALDGVRKFVGEIQI